MRKTWFTSDLHLGHENVIEFCKRPFRDVQHMDETLIQNWNDTVSDDDEVFLLGDACFHRAQVGVEALSWLRGRKVLVKGNHDKYSDSQYRRAGFTVIHEACIELEGMYFRLSHYPYKPSKGKIAAMDPHQLRFMDRRPPDTGSWLLCGHVHDKWRLFGRAINVGVDAWNYRPITSSDIKRLIAEAYGQQYVEGRKPDNIGGH